MEDALINKKTLYAIAVQQEQQAIQQLQKNFKKANLDLFNNNNTSNYIFEESSTIKNKNIEKYNNIYLGNLKPFCYNKKTGIPIITIGPHCNIFNYK